MGSPGGIPAATKTSAVPSPTVMVTCPGVFAVRVGGSSADRLTMLGLLDVQVRPATAFPFISNARMLRVSPTYIFIIDGVTITLVGFDELTVNCEELLHTPFCCTFKVPLRADDAILQIIWLSPQLETTP